VTGCSLGIRQVWVKRGDPAGPAAIVDHQKAAVTFAYRCAPNLTDPDGIYDKSSVFHFDPLAQMTTHLFEFIRSTRNGRAA